MLEKYLHKITEFKRQNCNELIPIAELNGVISFTRLYDALATPANGVSTGYEVNALYWGKYPLMA